MKIVVITGSPHKNGTSALLAGQFNLGASSAGHEVFRFRRGVLRRSPHAWAAALAGRPAALASTATRWTRST